VVSPELISLIKQVVLSWQVIAVSVALILYLSLVFYVARLYHRPHFYQHSPLKKPKKAAGEVPEEQVELDESDELNLAD
jgi:hypothetical protein